MGNVEGTCTSVERCSHAGRDAARPLRGVGKIFHSGKLPMNTKLLVYYNVVRLDFAPNWQAQLQV
jgi:hypothetical protein